jgi:hypothetical protein
MKQTKVYNLDNLAVIEFTQRENQKLEDLKIIESEKME